MIKLEHANLVVDELKPTLDFLLCAFPHWKVRQTGASQWYGTPRNWLHVGDDETYITLNDHGVGAPRDLTGNSQGLAHLGFVVHDIEALIERLHDKGYNPRIALDQAQPHRRNVYFVVAASKLEFEFVEYSSDDPTKRNATSELQ